LVIAGPKSREVLQAAAPRTDWSSTSFAWLTCQNVFIGNAEAVAMSVSFSGELAWELHIPNEQLEHAFKTLSAAGEAFSMKPFGLMATESMRLEKGYLHWKADLLTEFNPIETGLDRFVKMDKTFIGKQALEKMLEHEPRRQLVSLDINSKTASPHPGDSILSKGVVVGTITSAAYGHRTGSNIAYAFVEPQFVTRDAALEVQMLGLKVPAVLAEMCRYDVGNALLKQ